MALEERILKGIERLTVNNGIKAEWHKSGMKLSANAPIESEFFPSHLEFHRGYCHLPGPLPEMGLERPYFFLTFDSQLPQPDAKLIGNWDIWLNSLNREPKEAWKLLRVDNVPLRDLYCALDPRDALLSSIIDPFTQYFLAYAEGEEVNPRGKCRVTDTGEGLFLLTREFTKNRDELSLLWNACESTLAPLGAKAMVMFFEPENLLPASFGFEKVARGSLYSVT